MGKALVTFGVGSAEEFLQIAMPHFREYADRHGYELWTCHQIPQDRPASWFKVRMLIQALRNHDQVLWLDADIAILDKTTDIADDVPEGAWQALVCHHTPDGEVPNHGVWLVRPAMRPVLERIWGMTQYIHHPWWEQAASCELLGYNPTVRPMVREQNTELYQHTHWLELEWNSHRDDEAEDPWFWHASVRGDRAQLMREQLHAAA